MTSAAAEPRAEEHPTLLLEKAPLCISLSLSESPFLFSPSVSVAESDGPVLSSQRLAVLAFPVCLSPAHKMQKELLLARVILVSGVTTPENKIGPCLCLM